MTQFSPRHPHAVKCAFTFPDSRSFNQQLRSAALLSLQRKQLIADQGFSQSARAPLAQIGTGKLITPIERAAAVQGPLSARDELCNGTKGALLHSGNKEKQEVRREIVVTDKIKGYCTVIGRKAPEVFTNTREAFRMIDGNDNGYVNRTEIRYFFRLFNLSPEIADEVFEMLDHNASGDIYYDDFVGLMWPYIVPDVAVPICRQPVDVQAGSARQGRLDIAEHHDFERIAHMESKSMGGLAGCNTIQDSRDRATTTQQAHAIHKELQQMCQDIGFKLQLQWGPKLQIKLRHAFRLVDLDSSGMCTRAEVRHFCKSFGWGEKAADRLFELLNKDNEGEISHKKFTQIFIEAAQSQ